MVKYESKRRSNNAYAYGDLEFVFASWQEEAFLGFIDTHKSWVRKTPDFFKRVAGEYIPQRQAKWTVTKSF